MSAFAVLLGDSVFDNASYVGAGEAVIDHLRHALPDGWRCALAAADGTTTSDFQLQLERIPKGATHLVLSLGGNDALLDADLLDKPILSTSDALALFGQRAERFGTAYRRSIDQLLAFGLPTLVCTIYYGNLGGPEASGARVALSFFNDVILRTAFARKLAVIDLRLVCTDPSDYSSQIEPSAAGGAKIARAIASALVTSNPVEGASRVLWE